QPGFLQSKCELWEMDDRRMTLEKPALLRCRNGRSPGADAELAEDAGDVSGDGAHADEEVLGDLPIRVTTGNQAKHIELALAQRNDRRGSRHRRGAAPLSPLASPFPT